MNYFSHFFVDGIDDAYAHNTGLLLPDVTRKKVSKFLLHPDYNETGLAFYEGCKKHYAADKHFHASGFFKNILEQSNNIINQSNFDDTLNRKWFLAHILSELMLDRILVREYPQKLSQFYDSLQAIDDNELQLFLNLNGLSETGSFFDFFNHFRKVQYIYYYTDNNKFVYSLNRIMIQAKVGALTTYNEGVLMDASLELEQLLTRDTKQLIEQLIDSTK